MRNDDYYSSFGCERRKRGKLEEWMLYFIFCHRMELIVAYYYCGTQQHTTQHSIAHSTFQCYFSILFHFIWYVLLVQFSSEIYSIQFVSVFRTKFFGCWAPSIERASEWVYDEMRTWGTMIFFLHIKKHTHSIWICHLYSNIYEFSRVVEFFFFFFSLAIFNSTGTPLELHAIFCSRTYISICHAVQAVYKIICHLISGFFSLAFFLCSAYFFHFFLPYFINCSVCSRGARTHDFKSTLCMFSFFSVTNFFHVVLFCVLPFSAHTSEGKKTQVK